MSVRDTVLQERLINEERKNFRFNDACPACEAKDIDSLMLPIEQYCPDCRELLAEHKPVFEYSQWSAWNNNTQVLNLHIACMRELKAETQFGYELSNDGEAVTTDCEHCNK